jgi:hypothetical protein
MRTEPIPIVAAMTWKPQQEQPSLSQSVPPLWFAFDNAAWLEEGSSNFEHAGQIGAATLASVKMQSINATTNFRGFDARLLIGGLFYLMWRRPALSVTFEHLRARGCPKQ